MQQYLLQSKAASKRGTEVRRAIQERQLRAVNQKRKNLQRSMRRNFVYRHSLLLDQLRGSLRHGAYSQATRIAKSLIKASSQGAKLPLPRYWLRLAKIDQFRYRAERCEYALSLQGAPFSTPSTRRFFTTFEFNMMLERCKELEDWSHGYLISKLLLKRYLSPKFTFGRSVLDHGSPDSRTIHSMAEMFVKSQHPDRAELLFSTLVGRYPNPIPIGVYESYVQLLATDSRHIPQIELALRRLEKHGPTPTPTLYNAVLKAMGRQNGPDRIRRLVSQMIAGGFRPDQQTYRILIAQCLNHRNMQGAYDWLAEYERQGFEVRTSTLEPFLKTCSRWTVYYSGLQKQLPGPRSTKQRNPAKPTYDESAQEWLHQALLVFQIVSDRNLIPSMQMYNKLIEALLAQSRVSEAQKVLRVLMDTHLYIPTHATWALFFNHHLQASDHVAAMKVLTAMRKHPEPLTESSLAIQVPKPFRPIRPKPAVPTAMYSTLFQHLLDHGKASLAEQTLYDMMVHQKRTVRPTEKQVVDLIWKLTWDAEAAERVYEILFSQIQRSDKRGNSGPIHLAKVGVMSAKAHTTVPSQHEDVWRSWMAMTHHYQLHQQGRSKMALEKDQAVMSLAFEQVALAMRNLPTRKQGSFSYVKAQQQLQLQGKVRVSSVDGWDAGTFGAGGKGMQREGDVVTDRVDHMAVKGKLLHLIERLLRRPDYLHAEHSNLRDTVVLGTEGSSLRAQESESRLDYLKQSMAWVRQYGIPLRVEGMDVYLNGLISHRDLRSVQIMLAEITDFEPPLSSVPSSSSLTLATLLTRYREYT
ncbi:hypothetical protein BGZ94_007702 [Podila epigama]|nr:hypothetical protein BGZ94_007702 [Podila epigama]